MNITEILTQAQQSSDAVTDLLIELAQQNKEVSATAQHMCDLYFADVRLREKGIRDTPTPSIRLSPLRGAPTTR